ncbi:tetratricopeptide repeat protein [uncultured Draconibacterium sp.]|uniref:tetratricopeptide repeat protein n=1 Tax=uncultured Draconibacterium sp. TaxID=1573823 RepID=UPI0025F8388D|nr:tetratricopeptide repeat protein [uncultured Draconibacterium sp.]
MKKIIIFLLIIVPFFVFAQETNEQLWEKANAFYTTEEYQQAVSSYEQILATGEESAKLYFNLGNAYFKTGDINNAILNYERAKVLAPHDEDVAFNLQIANQYVVTKVEELPKPFFLRWKESVINKYPTDTWAFISIVSFVLFLLLLGAFLFSKRVALKRISFWIGIFSVLLSGFAFSHAAQQKNKINKRNHAIVFCPRVTVKSSPSETGTDLFLIYEGLKLEVTDQLNSWTEIKLADGNQGWLPDSCIVRI